MRIAFWSPMHGTGATANMLAVALAVAASGDRKILMTQTHYCMNNLEKPLIGELGGMRDSDFFRDTGIDAVVRYFKSGLLSRDIISNCSIDLTPNLVLLAGTKQSSRQTYDSLVMRRMVGYVLDTAEQYYDWVVIDTNSGYSAGSFETVENSDIVVVTLRQSRDMIDGLFASEDFKRIESKRIFFLFGSYDANSRYNLQNLRRMYKRITASNSGGLPHCTAYMDALCENRALNYMSANLVADEDIEDNEFFTELKEISAKIIAMAGVTEEQTSENQ